jgi:Ca-activated chloride channel family protein
MTWNWVLVLGGLVLLPALPLYADSLGDAYRAYEKGQFEEAAKGFQSHAQKQPEDYDQLYNTGVALFQKGAHEEAMTYFDRAMRSPDPGLKSRSAYNKGVALAQKQKWEEAETAFQDALSYDNDNQMIQDNLQFVRQQKNRQKQENPQESQAQNKQQQKDEKSEEKQAENQPGQSQSEKPEEKQAQNQNGQGQNAEQQKAEQANEAQKQAGQNKSGQSEAEKKAAQEKASQTEAQQQTAEGKPGEKGMQPGGQPGGQPGAQPQEGERVLTVKDLKKQEAEKILRSVDDRIGTYILTPEQANTEGKSRNGKDW